MVSANNFLSISCIKASKSIVTTEPCLLTCPALSLSGKCFNIDLHTAAGPWISGQLTSCAPFLSRYATEISWVCLLPQISVFDSAQFLPLNPQLKWLMHPFRLPLLGVFMLSNFGHLFLYRFLMHFYHQLSQFQFLCNPFSFQQCCWMLYKHLSKNCKTRTKNELHQVEWLIIILQLSQI